MNINEYKIDLYECKNGHNIKNILLNEFEETQKINMSDIQCNICKNNNKSISYNNIFYKCLTCNNNICPLCKCNHDKNHIIINYDEKYYICNEHNEKYISYCKDCNKNICKSCDGHKNHKNIIFSDILIKKDELIKKKNELKIIIDKFNSEIRILINILNEVSNKINIYYKIYEDIINNYENKNRNYEIIYNINQIQNNNTIIDELNKVIESNEILEKFNNIFNIYKKMNYDEINIIYNMKDKKGIRLFDSSFEERNKNNLKLIIDGKEQDLIGYYELKNNNKDILQIKLKGITNVINMGDMFHNCNSLSYLPDISKWNISNVKDMSDMFYNCKDSLNIPSKFKNFKNIK